MADRYTDMYMCIHNTRCLECAIELIFTWHMSKLCLHFGAFILVVMGLWLFSVFLLHNIMFYRV